jgi:hypothetical protein
MDHRWKAALLTAGIVVAAVIGLLISVAIVG